MKSLCQDFARSKPVLARLFASHVAFSQHAAMQPGRLRLWKLLGPAAQPNAAVLYREEQDEY